MRQFKHFITNMIFMIHHSWDLARSKYFVMIIQAVIVVISEYYYNESLNVSIRIPSETVNCDRSFYYLSNFNMTTETKFINQLLSSVYLPDGIVPVR